MADPTTKPEGTLEVLFNEHLVAPEGDDGIGSTLGEDVSAKRQRETDARFHAKDLPAEIDNDDDIET
jgi:hypothetical protein